MSKNIPSTSKSSESKDNSPLDPYAELEKLKILNDEINRKLMMCLPFLNPTGNSSNEMLQLLLDELKEMRMEIKEIKKDVNENKKRLEEIGENQKKLLRRERTSHQKSLKSVEREQDSQEQLNQQRTNASSIPNESKKKDELYSGKDIRRLINGEWRNVNHHNWYFSLKFEGDTFMQKLNGKSSYEKFAIGVKDQFYFTTVQNNKIVHKEFTDQGVEFERFDYYFEKGRLKRQYYIWGEEHSKFTFERIGDPDPL